MIEELSDSLVTKSNLEWLDLDNNNVGDDGAGYLSIALTKKPNCSLEILNLTKNNIRDNGIIDLSEALKKTNL